MLEFYYYSMYKGGLIKEWILVDKFCEDFKDWVC